MKELDVEKLFDIEGSYVEEVARFFQPLIPEGFRLRTHLDCGKDFEVHRINGSRVLYFKDGNLTFISSNSNIELNESLLTLAGKAIQHKEFLCKFKLTMDGLSK